MNERRKKNMSDTELFAWVNSKLIKKENECMEWSGAKHPKGYGLISVQCKTIKLHRFILEHKLQRKIDKNKCALHLCNNPPCCNPLHIIEGTNKENVDYKVQCDRQARGKFHGLKGELNSFAKLSESDIREIRKQTGIILQRDLAKAYNVSRTHISAIQTYKLWSHVK